MSSANPIRFLFIGETWAGSCARSLKEALSRNPRVALREVAEDDWFPKLSRRWVRALYRAVLPVQRNRFDRHVVACLREWAPEVLMTYKGFPVSANLVATARFLGALTVNVYPDYSPHTSGMRHRKAVGAYDLVVSTKVFHPASWRDVYGYTNRCEFVPQGYDPLLHLVSEPSDEHEYDVAMIATYRPEYGRLIADLARHLGDSHLRVIIGGHGWESVRASVPEAWMFPGAVTGPDYVAMLRRAKVCIAPLTRDVVINGQQQPGDVDTTRTYELAAANCFFIHRRTDYVRQLYGADEVPVYNDAQELAAKILYYLPRSEDRARMASAAHKRAVPAYSLDARAAQVLATVERELEKRRKLE